MFNLSKIILTTVLLQAISTSAAHAVNCGSRDLGFLPNQSTRFCLGERVNRYTYCGGSAGVLVGVTDHPIFCETTWSPDPNTVEVCANERFYQQATRAGTTRDRAMYSRNEGWLWSPNRSSVCSGEPFEQTSNCGFNRTKTGTKDCGCVDSWSPSRDSICEGETFTQTSSCGGTRERTGRMECEEEPEIDVNVKDPRTIWTTTAQGDEGYFQFNGSETNIMVIYNDNQDNIVRRYRSPSGHAYKVWIDDGEPGGWPLNIVDRESFDIWIDYIDEIKPNGQEYHPNKHWCELVENIWSPWVTDPIPTECGVHTYQRRRTCSQQSAAKPCPFSCPNGSMNQTVVENLTIDNGSCGGGNPDPDPTPEWDFTTITDVNPALWSTSNLSGNACLRWRSGSLGEDKQRKILQMDTSNTGTTYPCSTPGETDFCYVVYSEGNPNNITTVDQVNFRCQ